MYRIRNLLQLSSNMCPFAQYNCTAHFDCKAKSFRPLKAFLSSHIPQEKRIQPCKKAFFAPAIFPDGEP